MRVFQGIDDVRDSAGESLGASDWMTLDQPTIDRFAEATGDHQWIHVDAERAKDGPFGTTIAHGFLTLSLLVVLNHQLYRVENTSMTVNYGLNKVRFPAPVKVGSRVRSATQLASVTDVSGGVQAEFATTIEIEGADKPACTAESVLRFFA